MEPDWLYQDDRGRYFDFHALRGQFITMLIKNGVSVATAQQFARRHIQLTMGYTDKEALGTREALEQFPAVKKTDDRKKPESEKTPDPEKKPDAA